MVMIHSDDKGLVLPPRIAKIQVIVIPLGITAKTTDEVKQQHSEKLEQVAADLKKAGVRVDVDARDTYTPPWKFNDWELKGVPLRLEFGCVSQKNTKNILPMKALTRDTQTQGYGEGGCQLRTP